MSSPVNRTDKIPTRTQDTTSLIDTDSLHVQVRHVHGSSLSTLITVEPSCVVVVDIIDVDVGVVVGVAVVKSCPPVRTTQQ